MNDNPAASRIPILRLALLALLSGIPVLANTARQPFHWLGRIPEGQTIEILGYSGDVQAELAGGDEVEVFAIRHGERPERIRIDVLDRDGGITIAAVYPPRHRNDSTKVDFRVRVPAGVRLVAKTVNGRVRAAGLASDVEAQTLNGGIEIATSRSARAETINGSIVASVGEVRKDGGKEFTAVNGSVVLDLPGVVDANLDVETLNGEIRSELACRGEPGSRRLTGVLGKGGPMLSIRTSNGGIWLLRTV